MVSDLTQVCFGTDMNTIQQPDAKVEAPVSLIGMN